MRKMGFTFEAGSTSASVEPRMRILASCVALQQSANFGTHLDIREAKCERCGASGFNTGWGYVAFACGAEMLTSGDVDAPCPKAEG